MATSDQRPLTIVGIGAHMDDCWLGFGATALKAVRNGHRVVFVTAVTNPRYLSYLAGRDAEIAAFLARQSAAVGIRYVGLGHDYMRLVHAPPLVEQLARVLAELQADILFCHDQNERNQDHVALGGASEIAAQHLGCFVADGPGGPAKQPAEIYRYCTGWQSLGFVPDVHVACSDTMLDALDLCSSYDELYAAGRWPTPCATLTDHQLGDRTVRLTGHSRFKHAQAVLAGGGDGYAEAFKSVTPAFVGSRLARACGLAGPA